MEETEFKALLDRYALGQSTPEERELILALLDSYERAQEELVLSAAEKSQLHDAMLSSILNNVQERPHKRFLKVYKWAAAALILIVGGLLITFHFNGSSGPVMALHQDSPHPAAENNNRAYLKLGNGKMVVLDSTGKGLVALQGGTSITKNGNLSLQYSAKQQNASGPVSDNTVSTPSGSTYQVVLPDGTRVWLNAVSSITFPTKFDGSSRNVRLTGEAYFEVAKREVSLKGHTGRQPFIVTTGGAEIEVLGTHFNVTFYAENGQQETTLLEGAVNVRHGGQLKAILPGEQAVYSSTGRSIMVRKANLETVMAWKDGLFSFDNADISTVMNEISRWYNARLVYQGEVPSTGFTGILPRNTDLPSMLEWLESTHAVRLKLDGNVITIEKSK